ncbi:nucleotide-binding universal stress UspA family protein [Saccharothrix ecbatanensis]|uniref:Nucleotide-binding universal stress UspA family protein n=1 Tax=Saccharothrix ecbatanensis TaxID=1105145 RepID=A0A7W9HGF5_9PSEU|nr:universal stress protein [Saccharothrix ecbatanensis]MBB5801503.1 nucleotide-binding universal stress UspA family protein [Saccharothrix ecbatanensis]
MSSPGHGDARGAVVVGFDGSEPARLAAFWAAREAASRRRRLLVVNVLRGPMPELAMSPLAVPLPDAVTDEAVRGYAEKELAEVAAECERVSPGLDVRTSLEDGYAADALSRVAQGADLLAVGSSGRSGLSRALLGSTTADLVHAHPGPIVVARGDGAEDGRVVVGVDGSETSVRAVAFAFEYASRRGGDLLAVHAWADLPLEALAPLREQDANRRQVEEQAAALIDRSLAPHRQDYPDVRVSRVVAFDGPAHALLDNAREASLIVVGSHGRGAVRRALLGSVGHAVLYHAPCSVAVVHRDQATSGGTS